MRLARAVTRLAEAVNEVVGHPVAFLLALIQTALWTVMIVLYPHLDPHGFWFLYSATAVSYVTQFTLTLVGLTAKKEAQRSADQSAKNSEASLVLMHTIHALVEAVQADIASRDEGLDDQLEDIHEDLQVFVKTKESSLEPLSVAALRAGRAAAEREANDRQDGETDEGAGRATGEYDREQHDPEDCDDRDQDHQSTEAE